jgi:hypothetical protein
MAEPRCRRFLAPFLVAREPGGGLLFAWFAVINARRHRAWRTQRARAVFTFGAGDLLGWRWYSPQHFAIVQPFLAVLRVLPRRRDPLREARAARVAQARGRAIVFGMPVAAFALEAGS